jgi:hypothetical protein
MKKNFFLISNFNLKKYLDALERKNKLRKGDLVIKNLG